jgi:dipeptidyl aminopeptidase/acylaminoacyl peptidase
MTKSGSSTRALVLLIGPALAFLISLPATATGRAFEIADYYRAVSVESPVVAPDGGLVAFVVHRYDLPKAEDWQEIWTVRPDGSGLRQMTTGHHDDASPVFSPDGKSLLFTSDREGDRTQLFVMPVDGGEARKLTDFALDLKDPRWSPDGRWIAVTADVFPECGADGACNGKLRKGIDEGELQVHVADDLLYRHWTSWRDGTYAHVLLVAAASGEVMRDLTPGAWDSPTFSLSGDRGYDFSPDGKSVVYVSNHEAHPESSTNADLWLVPLEGEVTETTAANLTAGNPGWDGAPLFSPDGRRIAYRSQAQNGYESDLFRIAVYDLDAKTTRYLTDREVFDNWVTEIAWAPDGRSIVFQGEYHARNPLYRIPAAGGAVEPLVTDGTIDGWDLLPGGGVVYVRRTIDHPRELYRADLGGAAAAQPAADAVQLTHFNRELEREVDFRPAEETWVDGAGDYKVHVFVIKPHGFDPAKKYPLILNVHGGPQSAFTDAFRGDWQVYPGKGYVVAFANPTGSTGYGQEFTEAISGDWGGRVFDDLMKVTDVLEELPYVDRTRMGSMGWSYGGYMMMWFEGHTHRFAASAAMMGVYDLEAMYGATEELWFPERDLGGAPWTSDLYTRWSPSEFVEEFKTPSLVITGERDYRVPYTLSLEYFTALRKQAVPSRLIVFEKAGHWPSWYEMALYYDAHLDWFHRYLGGGEAPWDVKELARNQVFAEQQDGGGEEAKE